MLMQPLYLSLTLLTHMASPKEAEVLVSGSLGRAAALSLPKKGVRWRPDLASSVWELDAPVAEVARLEEGKVSQNRHSNSHHGKAGFSSYK